MERVAKVADGVAEQSVDRECSLDQGTVVWMPVGRVNMCSENWMLQFSNGLALLWGFGFVAYTV